MKSIYFYDNTYVRTLFFPIDTIILNDKDGNPVPLTKTGIAWESDKKYKFQNPVVPEGMTLENCKETPTSYLDTDSRHYKPRLVYFLPYF